MTIEELKAFFANDRVAVGMGCEIIEADVSHSVVTIDVEDKHLNGNNVVQGGVLFTLADFACAVAANADTPAFVSADGNISYLCAGTGKKLIANAKVIRKGKTLAFCTAEITDETDKLLATANFTMCRVKQ